MTLTVTISADASWFYLFGVMNIGVWLACIDSDDNVLKCATGINAGIGMGLIGLIAHRQLTTDE